MKHLRSAVVFGVVGVLAVLGWATGVIAVAWTGQSVWTHSIILVIVSCCAWCVFASMRDRRWVARGLTLCPYLGLFGTALGICQELQAIHADADIARVVSGLGVAFWSTVTGIGSAIVIYLQGIALDSEEAADAQ